MRVQRQAEQWWGAPDQNPRSMTGAPSPEFDALLGGKRIHAGLLNWAAADPNDTAYHREPSRGHGDWNEWLREYEYAPEDDEQHERALEDEESGYNWGPPPEHDPGEEPGPHPDFHGDAPHPFGTPIYLPGRGDDEFHEARRLEAIVDPWAGWPGQLPGDQIVDVAQEAKDKVPRKLAPPREKTPPSQQVSNPNMLPPEERQTVASHEVCGHCGRPGHHRSAHREQRP